MIFAKVRNLFTRLNQGNDVLPEDESSLSALTNTEKILKKAYLIVGLSFLIFFIWSLAVPLDEGVPVNGTVVIDTKAKIVQHPQGGVIKKIYVKEGQFVQEGDLLIKLQDLVALANLEFEKNRLQKLGSLEKELKATIPLVKDGYIPVVRQLELEREVADLKSTPERLRASQDELIKTEIRAPVTGQVVGLITQTIGGVIQASQKIMEVVPRNEQFVVELKVPPHFIDRVHLNDIVDLRFATFSKSPMLVVSGQIVSISSDVTLDNSANPLNPMSTPSYYLARVSLTEDGFKKLGHREMISGMPVSGVVKTGSRTLFQYVMQPIIQRIAFSMKEE